MGIKKSFKKAIIKKVMKERKAVQEFDEVASEFHTLPKDADETINSSYYYASHDKDGNAFFMRLGERGGENPVAEIWFGVTTADGKAYMNKEQLYPLDKSPIKTNCIEPLRKWEFSFDGVMIPVVAGDNKVALQSGDEVNATFSGIFTSEHGLFEFSRDTDIGSYANAIASEKWVKGFSDELKKNHQTRIEQIGHAVCEFNVEGNTYKIDAPALRDQAYGRRIWSYMNHYSWLVGNLEDGRAFNTVMVLYPTINVTGLKTGYVHEDGKYISLTNVDYPKEFTTKGTAPTKGTAKAKFANKKTANIEFESKIIFPYNFTDNEGGYNIFESITTFYFNGVKGYGIAEFSYNADKKRYENAFTQAFGVKQ